MNEYADEFGLIHWESNQRFHRTPVDYSAEKARPLKEKKKRREKRWQNRKNRR